MSAIASDLGTSSDKAEVFVEELEKLKDAKGPEEQMRAIELLRKTISWAFTKDIPESIAALEEALIEAGPVLIDLQYREIDPTGEARTLREGAKSGGGRKKQEQAGPPDLLGIAGMNEQLDALREAMRTQEEIVADAFLKRQQTIGWAVQNERMTHQEAYQMSLRSEQQFREQMAALQANQYQAAFDRQGEMLLTEKERISVWYAEQLELLMNYYNERGTLDEAYYTRLEQLKAEHDERMNRLEAAKSQTQQNMVRGMFANLLTITQGSNKKMFEMVKMAAIAEATVSGIKAAVEAWEAGMSVGGPTAPATAALYAAASLARTGAMISQLKSASFSGGGGSGGAGGGATAAAPAAPTVSRNVAIQLTGGDMYSREQVVGLINSINEAVEDGAVIRLV